MCKQWGCLPDELERQDAVELLRLSAAARVYNTMNSYQNAESAAQWSLDHPEEWKRVVTILEMRRNA